MRFFESSEVLAEKTSKGQFKSNELMLAIH